uniref:Uncharacterized protein n=1 Tax=Arundo donax TaxID=35708 RepID=A0A0A9B8U3_ARUDO
MAAAPTGYMGRWDAEISAHYYTLSIINNQSHQRRSQISLEMLAKCPNQLGIDRSCDRISGLSDASLPGCSGYPHVSITFVTFS